MIEELTADIETCYQLVIDNDPLIRWMTEQGHDPREGGIIIIPQSWEDQLRADGHGIPPYIRTSHRLPDGPAVLSRDHNVQNMAVNRPESNAEGLSGYQAHIWPYQPKPITERG
jgi:hypothetical protein